MTDITTEWVEKVTREGMEIYLTLLERRQKGFAEVAQEKAKEAGQQKTQELRAQLLFYVR